MSLHLKKTSIALAVAAVTGVTFAAPTPTYQTAVDAELNTNYQQTTGTTETTTPSTGTTVTVSKEDIATGDLVSSTAPVINGPEVQIGGINYRNYSYQEIRKGLLEARNDKNSNTTAADGTNTVSSSWDTTTATGQAKRTANTRIQLDKTINPATEIAGTKERLDDSSFEFTNDDVNTVIDARTTSDKGSSEDIVYAAADERINSSKFQNITSDLTTKAKLGTDGKPVAGQTIRVGTVEDMISSNDVYYKSESLTGGLTKSKNANGILSSEELNSAQHNVSTSYQHKDNDLTKEVVAFNLTADKKNILESTVNTNKSSFSNKEVDYDDVNAAGLNYTNEFKTSHDNSTESLLDGFISIDKASFEFSGTEYNQAVLGTNNALDYIETFKSSEESKTRDFVKNSDGEIVLTAGKPTVNTETEIKKTSESYDSVYQPTRYNADDAARGIAKGDAYNEHILNTGVPTEWDWWRSTNVQKSTLKATESTIVTHKQDGDFKEHWNKAWDNSTVYARNHQENIEVDRDISQSYSEDERTLNKAYKVGETVATAREDEQFALGTVRVNDQGRVLTSADVKTWKDETGKERYYVEIGTDAEGHQIRSEVTFKNGKPEVKKDVLVDVVDTKAIDEKRTDKVRMGEEVAYNTKTSTKDESATISRDGSIVYESEKFNETTDTNVYSIGKNALDYQKVVEGSNATVKSDYKLDANNNVVVTAVNSTNDTWKNTTQQFQPGQEKKSVQSNAGTWNDTKTVDGIEVAYDRGTDEKTTTEYNTGKNELDRTIVSKEIGETKDQGLVTISTNIRPVDENGNKITAGGVLALDENGEDVVSKATNTVATVKTDTVTKTTNNVDEKVYQTGVTAYSKVESNSSDAVITYSDNTTGYAKSANNSDVKLYNHGESDKYRDFTSLNTSSSKENQYALDDAGKAVLDYTEEKSNSTANTEVDYQAGKNALDNSRNTVVKNTNTKTSADKTVTTEDATTTDVLTYQEGHELNDTFTEVSAGQEKLTKADGTGYTYTTSGKEETKNYSSRMGLLASGDVKQSFKTEETETLAQTGKSTVSITRGNEAVARTDSSFTTAQYGSETVTAADGLTTTVAKKLVTEADKLEIVDSTTQTRTETKVAADKSSTSNTATRVDSVNGIVVSATKTQTDAAGNANTTESKTTIDANSVTTNHVVAERITLQGGKDLQGEINRIDSRVNQLNSRVDDVQKTAYRGIAIALAAQQAVPNITPGQVAVFGGVGHYEGETAGSIGVVTSFTDRISASGAFGFASGNEFGGRVGVAYVFGGK